MIVISRDLALAGMSAVSGGGVINSDNPVIGYQQLVTSGNVSATTSESGHPASLLANPSTNLYWKGELASPEADEYITLSLNTAEMVDYVGIARHNFGTAQIAVSLEAINDDSPVGWDVIVEEFIPADDAPILMRFVEQAVTSIRIRLRPGTVAPRAAVVYSGKLLVLQRRIYVGHTPITMGLSSRISNGRSESGDFLGRVVLHEVTSTKIDLQNLTPAWLRENILPFLKSANENPFFFAWRPGTYPLEVGYAWLSVDARPVNQSSNGFMNVSFDISGIV